MAKANLRAFKSVPYPPFSVPASITLSSNDWVFIVHEAGKRIDTSEYNEQPGKKRTDNWNTIVTGVAGEFAAFKSVQHRYAKISTLLGIYKWVVAQGDIVVDGKPFEIKAKIGSGYFCINKRSHERDKRNTVGLTGYVPVLIERLYAPRVVVGTVIPYATVEGWPCDDFQKNGAPHYRTPVRGLIAV